MNKPKHPLPSSATRWRMSSGAAKNEHLWLGSRFSSIWIHATDTIGFDWAEFFPLWTSTEIMRIVKCLVEIPVNRPLQYSVRFVCFLFFFMEPTVVSWQQYKWTTGASLILSTALPHYYQDGCHCGSNSFMLLVCPCPTCTVSISSVFCSFHQ